MSSKLIAYQPTDIVAPLMAWFKGATGRRTLADMPDYLLKDIGVRRDQLAGLAAGALASDAAETVVAPAPAPAHGPAKVVPFGPRRKGGAARPEKPMAA
jgi:uncharacterized protein YjiS (DUF1127 family)